MKTIFLLLVLSLLQLPFAEAATKTKKSAKATTETKKEEPAKTGADLDPAAGANPPPNTVAGQQPTLVPIPEKGEDAIKNNRLATLEGSKSPFSGQLQFAYSGSSIDHPFSESAPNPSGIAPPPLVTLSGTGSVRYRIDPHTTTSVGTGITTQTPFQGPKNTTVADPYVDIARSYRVGPVQGRASFAFTYWTNDQYRNELGYRTEYSLANEAFYEWDFGLTTGLAFNLDANTFASQNYSQAVRANQFTHQFQFTPYLEYKLTDILNFRTVVGIPFQHTRGLDGFFTFNRPLAYQTFGVGVAATKWLFVYPYLQFFPGKMAVDQTILGFSAIVNLF